MAAPPTDTPPDANAEDLSARDVDFLVTPVAPASEAISSPLSGGSPLDPYAEEDEEDYRSGGSSLGGALGSHGSRRGGDSVGGLGDVTPLDDDYYSDPPDETLRVVVTQDGVTTIALGSGPPGEEDEEEGLGLEKEECQVDRTRADSEAASRPLSASRDSDLRHYDVHLGEEDDGEEARYISSSQAVLNAGGSELDGDSLRLSRGGEDIPNRTDGLQSGEVQRYDSTDGDAKVLRTLLVPQGQDPSSVRGQSQDSDLKVFRELVPQNSSLGQRSQDSDSIVCNALLENVPNAASQESFLELEPGLRSQGSIEICKELLRYQSKSQDSSDFRVYQELVGGSLKSQSSDEKVFRELVFGGGCKSQDSDEKVFQELVLNAPSSSFSRSTTQNSDEKVFQVLVHGGGSRAELGTTSALSKSQDSFSKEFLHEGEEVDRACTSEALRDLAYERDETGGGRNLLRGQARGGGAASADSDLKVYQALVKSVDSRSDVGEEKPLEDEKAKVEPTILLVQESQVLTTEAPAPPAPPQQQRRRQQQQQQNGRGGNEVASTSAVPASTKLNGEPSSNPLSLDQEKIFEAEVVLGEGAKLTEGDLEELSKVSLLREGEELTEEEAKTTSVLLSPPKSARSKAATPTVSFDLSSAKEVDKDSGKEESSSAGVPANPSASPRHYPNQRPSEQLANDGQDDGGGGPDNGHVPATAAEGQDGGSEEGEEEFDASQVGCLGWRLGGGGKKSKRNGGPGGRTSKRRLGSASSNQVLRDHCRSRDCVRT